MANNSNPKQLKRQARFYVEDKTKVERQFIKSLLIENKASKRRIACSGDKFHQLRKEYEYEEDIEKDEVDGINIDPITSPSKVNKVCALLNVSEQMVILYT